MKCHYHKCPNITRIHPCEIKSHHLGIDANVSEDLGLAQIFPLADEDNSSPPYVVGTSFADPFILIAKSDGSLSFLRADESGDLDEIEQSDALTNQKWISGCLYEDLNDVFRLEFSDDEEDVSNVLAFLSSASGGLHVSSISTVQDPSFRDEQSI